MCYNQCPRTITIESSLIGNVRDVFTARTMMPGVKGQDGGVLTSMLLYALEEGLIDSAVVTVKSEEEPWKPLPIVAQTSEDVLRSRGSIYVHSLTMETLMSAIKKGSRSIAFVGPSCNIDAFRNGSCTVCTDLTAEKADLSFGGVGSKEGYTTVLARTGLGLELFKDA